MHIRENHPVTQVFQVPTGYKWFDPRDGRVKDEVALIFYTEQHQDAKKRVKDTPDILPNGLVYDWNERRTEVIERIGTNAKQWTQPLGYVEAFDASKSKVEKALLSAELRAAEIAYLESTQDQELAPQWLELRENGIEAVPLNYKSAEEDIDFGEQVTEEQQREMLVDYTLAGIKDGHRIEQWMRETDRTYMHNGIVKRLKWIERDGKRGLVPDWNMSDEEKERVKNKIRAIIAEGMAPTPEQIQRIAERKAESAWRRETYGKYWRWSYLTPSEWDALLDAKQDHEWLDSLDPDRLAIAAAEQEEYYESIRPKIGDPCPDGCRDGQAPTGEFYNTIVNDEWVKMPEYDDCPTCNGRGTVMAALGFSIDIWEGVEFMEDPVQSDNIFDILDFEAVTS